MLDLKKLEEKLDAALAKETKESIEAWLSEQRNTEFNALLKDNAFLSGTVEGVCELGVFSVSFDTAVTTAVSTSVEIAMPSVLSKAA